MATKKNETKNETATDEQKNAVSVAEAVLKEVQENGGGSKRRGANGNGDSTRSPEVLAKERARRQQRYDIHDQIPELHDMDRAWRKKYREAKAVKASKGAESPEAKSAWQAYLDERQKYRVKRGEYGFPIGSKETAEVDETETAPTPPKKEKAVKAEKTPKTQTAVATSDTGTGVPPTGKARRMPRVKKSDEGGNDTGE